MTMLEKYYTPEQLDTLEQRRKELGDEAQEQYHRDWDELIATPGGPSRPIGAS